jgi:hypothetical protein
MKPHEDLISILCVNDAACGPDKLMIARNSRDFYDDLNDLPEDGPFMDTI